MNSFVEAVSHWLRGFAPQPVTVNNAERIRACCGALIGVFLTILVNRLLLGPTPGLPLLLAPLGASAVLLFAAPASPLAQPWSVMGGNLTSAIIGVAFAQWIADPMLAAALALAAAIGMMFALRCLHPPSGAIALTAVLGGPAIQAHGFHFVLSPVAVSSSLLLLTAILFNNITRRRYPHPPQLDHRNPHRTADPRPTDRIGFTPTDLEDVLKQYNQVLDVTRDDLETIFLQTEMHAYRRRFGEITCADIMSRDLVTAEFGTTLEQAWALMREHRIKALPVIDRARRITGIVTLADFMKHAQLDAYDGFEARLRRFIQRIPFTHSEKPEVVGQIMTRAVVTADHNMHIVEVVPLLSDYGLHHIPVLDDAQRLVGIVTQSDLIAALYRGRVVDAAESDIRH
jgi:CBS domain-containing membrane protein